MQTDSEDEAVLSKLKKILARMFKIKEEVIRMDSGLKDDLGIDSIDIWEIIFKLEEEFNIRVPEDDVPVVSTVQDVVNAIEKRMKARTEK